MIGKGSSLVLSAVVSVALVGASGCDSGGTTTDSGGSARTVIQNTGSDTMVNLAQSWAEEYREVKPDVSIEVSGGGSGVGIRDLMTGIVDIANASRTLKPDEEAQAKRKTGKDPIEFTVAYDGIGIYVHKDNPLEEITLAQLAEIYRENGSITKWSQLGADADSFCSGDDIVVFSRQSNSGTYVYFREAVLGKGDFRLGTKDLHGSKDVVDAVAHTPCGIGYSGMGYKTDEVKFLKVSTGEGQPSILPTTENVLSKKYPIARPLYMYTLGEPTGAAKEYIDWVFSEAGQKVVVEEGYVPIPSKSS